MWRKLKILLKREAVLITRNPSEIIQPGVFYCLLLILLPLSLEPDPQLLQQVAPGWIWLGVLLANILGLTRLFHRDAQEGSLEQYQLGPMPLSYYVNIKLFTHWLSLILPLILLVPILSVLLQLPNQAMLTLILSLLFGSPALTCLMATGAALMLVSRQQAVLASVLILPLTVPIIIFASGAVQNSLADLPVRGLLLLLLALSVLSMTLLPLAITSLLRLSR